MTTQENNMPKIGLTTVFIAIQESYNKVLLCW